MKDAIYETIAQNIANESLEYKFEDTIELLTEEIAESLSFKRLLDQAIHKVTNDKFTKVFKQPHHVTPKKTKPYSKSKWQEILSKVPYSQYLNESIGGIKEYDSETANKFMEAYGITNYKEEFKEHHQKCIDDLKGLSAVLNDISYLAIYELDRIDGWKGDRDGNPEDAFKRDLEREYHHHPDKKVLLCALEILDQSLDTYTQHSSKRLSLKERVEQYAAALESKGPEIHREDTSTAASSGDTREPRSEVVKSVVDNVFSKLLDTNHQPRQ